MKYPKSLQDLIDSFAMYPGIGPKTAERLAFFTIQKMKKEHVDLFSKNLINAVETIKKCSICGNFTDNDICDICKDNSRNNTLIIVESSKDVIVFERINQYNGKYHVLNGLISPLNGIGPDEIGINSLFNRIKNEDIREVIVATSSTIDGEMTAMYITNCLKDSNVDVYRIGYGLPAGADIEYADDITLIRALEGKRKI